MVVLEHSVPPDSRLHGVNVHVLVVHINRHLQVSGTFEMGRRSSPAKGSFKFDYSFRRALPQTFVLRIMRFVTFIEVGGRAGTLI